ncbi:hypothetical protein CIW49_02405 [Mycolicibacterium sp. P1-18]|uniref:hypothetical protein n=1 Tax=Mycolicibacterium sp. P1-18 TaxID=2024615 RepID=UPI0011F15BE7|nr:hypothetical protein [Mycolicibacterium sp. P1-18]KAA0102194.1 hypothetical protein CIW49_02405 [Mycolicibacterium sp. P1-18]
MSSSGDKYPAPEVVLLIVFVGATILIVVTGYHHPGLALAVWLGVGYALSGVSRLVRQVRRLANGERR